MSLAARRSPLALGLVLTAVTSAAASTARYRVVRFDAPYAAVSELPTLATSVPCPPFLCGDYRTPFFEEVTATSYAYGINEDGVVVGTTYVCSEGDCVQPFRFPVYRPFAWQPTAIHGTLATGTLNVLDLPSDLPGDRDASRWGAALDVNLSGDIVGASGAQGVGSDLGFLWAQQAGFGLVPGQVGGFVGLDAADGSDSAARGISDRGMDGAIETAIVAGQASGLNPCPCATVPFADPSMWDLASGLTGQILPYDCNSTFVFELGGLQDVNESAVVDGAFVAGLTQKCSVDAQCRNTTDRLPSAWDLDSAFVNPVIPLGVGVDSWTNGYVLAVDGDRSMVGYLERGVQACVPQAARWTRSSDVDPFQLELLESPSSADDRSSAYGMNSLGLVVGTGGGATLEAILWDGTGSGDFLTDLVDCEDCGLEFIRTGYDVNDAGWIVAAAAFNTSGAPSFESEIGVLLVPLGDCPADINQDGRVDRTDLALVDTTTGCQPYRICWADVNGDCRVDQADRRIVLESMTSEVCGTTTLSTPLAEIWLSAGGSTFLDAAPDAEVQVEGAFVDGEEIGTFLNLMVLVASGGNP